MHDIKFIRDNPDAFDAAMARRSLPPQSAEILKLDEALRTTQTKLQELQAARNAKSKEIGQIKSQKGEEGGDADALMVEVAALKDEMQALEEKENEGQEQLKDVLSRLPQILADDVPDGADDTQNRVEHTWGSPKEFDFQAKEHHELGEALNLMDFERAAKVAGARFVYLKGALAKLERALASLMLDTLTDEHGFEEFIPPFMTNATAMYGTGNLPKFEEDLFKTTDGRYLIPTSEVVLANYHAGEILPESEVHKRYCAYTPCFRSEAGSAGRDTTGMIRQHQFTKVEMVGICKPQDAWAEQKNLLACSESVLQKLGLPYQVVTLCTGDTGAWSMKTFDIEVWLPGQARFREISSVSNCGDYQARRMKLRYKTAEGKNALPHTLNGSCLAVGRTLIAVMENYQQADGTIKVPDALKSYMGGLDVIGAPKKEKAA